MMNLFTANDTCGSQMKQLDVVSNETLANGFDFLCYVSLNDATLANMSCSNFLRDLQGGFTDSAALTAGGGRFGCYQSANGLTDPRRYGACQARHETSAGPSSCSTCTHMFVCIDYPGEMQYATIIQE